MDKRVKCHIPSRVFNTTHAPIQNEDTPRFKKNILFPDSSCTYNDGVDCKKYTDLSGTCTGGYYQGKIRTTYSNITCLPWSNFDGFYDDEHFTAIDGSRVKAENYCRNPKKNDAKKPWCYTKYTGTKKWEVCHIAPCGTILEMGYISSCHLVP
jgi:hypothetical protein